MSQSTRCLVCIPLVAATATSAVSATTLLGASARSSFLLLLLLPSGLPQPCWRARHLLTFGQENPQLSLLLQELPDLGLASFLFPCGWGLIPYPVLSHCISRLVRSFGARVRNNNKNTLVPAPTANPPEPAYSLQTTKCGYPSAASLRLSFAKNLHMCHMIRHSAAPSSSGREGGASSTEHHRP